ncbi:MAG: gliding motility protein GldC [Flavobacteriales bacterium]|nr:gliding motility protein GldC [Flavobacteriales bacterium]|tara:strand:- start:1973 stop:2302 length:330 start_codon:yes stop_codon:yes gene_type:complete
MKKEIKFTVTLDENLIPEKLDWTASEGGGVSEEEIKALMISVWDGKEKVAKRVDLWTKEMRVDEMKYFHFQTLMTLADSLERSTKENVVADKIREFGMQIGKEMEILTK